MIIDKNKTVNGIKLFENPFKAVEELKPLCRKIAAEGNVLLKNDGVLPLQKGTRISLFGRNQEGYIKSGTGSGGLVRTDKTPIIWDSFDECETLTVNERLIEIYKEWIKDNPYDNGNGWATEPWCQKEMPITFEMASDFAKETDVAVVIIGRTAGEDKDNSNSEGSYRLTAEEERMLENVCSAFSKTVVVLNVGNLIDLTFMDNYDISAVLYAWQGGQEGADALVDVLSGKVSPSGKLADTQVLDVTDYPSLGDFGNKEKLVYNEDIYVGYRYFETFAPEKVRYPFGFGLTYTDFDIKYSAKVLGDTVLVDAAVENIGKYTARQVVQVYFGAPCGKLGTPIKQLAGFAKTKELAPGEKQSLSISISKNQMASFDDSGITGNKNCYVLEKGEYKIFAGTDVRSSAEVLSFALEETEVVSALEESMAPIEPFERMVAKEMDGKRVICFEPAPLKEQDDDARIIERREKEIPYTGDKGIKLIDVAESKNSMDEFIAQLSERNLINIVCGEGMNSPRVTPGTGAAFGGVSDELLDFGIPACCATDGPSGIRIDSDNYTTTSLPNGYLFASAFDTELTEKIFEYVGVELFRYNLDALLGPGMNIHRTPLCGRNFEYFSEDPLLSGKIAAAQTRGMATSGCSTTIKHFCGNNQELGRHSTDDVVSQRALREIYLKGFEIAVKEGNATALMTSYNKVNGYYSASNYDLTTTILRKEWGYKGFVMTDWWANANSKNGAGSIDNLKEMVRAQNDIYMVNLNAQYKKNNIKEGLDEGYIVLSDLQRCAKNLLRYIINSPTFIKFVEGGCKKQYTENFEIYNDMPILFVAENLKTDEAVKAEFGGDNLFIFELASNADALAQSTVTVRVDDFLMTLSVSGTNGETVEIKRILKSNAACHTISFNFPPAVEVRKITIK